MWNLNALTPETERTTHYFWAQAHDFSPRDAAVTERLFQEIYATFKQDWEILEAQQRSIEAAPDAPTIDIRVDAGPLQARRLVDRLFAEQSAGRPQAAE